jgi:hypothetical protein
MYKAVWPLGRSTVRATSLKPRLDTLNGKTIAHLSHFGFRDQEIRPIVKESLRKQFPEVRFIDEEVFGNIKGRDEAQVLAGLPAKFREYGADAVITGIGS